MVRPFFCRSFSDRRRPNTSTPPPAANGTMILMGRSPSFRDCATEGAGTSAVDTMATDERMNWRRTINADMIFLPDRRSKARPAVCRSCRVSGRARLCLPDESCRAQRVDDLDFGAGLERQQRRADGGVLKDAARDQAMLERDRAFHVRAAMVDGARNWQQLVMNRARLRVVLGLAGRNQLDQRLGRETAIAHQRAVDIEHGVQQIFVVA